MNFIFNPVFIFLNKTCYKNANILCFYDFYYQTCVFFYKKKGKMFSKIASKITYDSYFIP